MPTFHLASPGPSTFLLSIFCKIIRILPCIVFPILPLRYLLSLLCGGLFRLTLWLGGTGLANNRADLLCGLGFTLTLSPLESLPAFLWGMGRRRGPQQSSSVRVWSVRGCLAASSHCSILMSYVLIEQFCEVVNILVMHKNLFSDCMSFQLLWFWILSF